MSKSIQLQLNRTTQAVLLAISLAAQSPLAQAGAGFADNTDKGGVPFKQPTYYANSPAGVLPAHGPLSASGTIVPGVSEGSTRDTGTALRKFVDTLPLVDGYVTNTGLVNANAPTAPGRHIPMAIKEAVPAGSTAHSVSYPDADFYEIAVVEYREQLHSDLPPVVKTTNPTTGGVISTGGTTLRGYVQIATPNLPAGTKTSQLWRLDGTPVLDNKGKPVFIVGDQPHYLGPIIDSQSGVPVRIKFDNYLPIGHYDPITKTRGGDTFIPTDYTVPGSGLGPNGAIDPNAPQPFERYTENRTNIHLHGGDTPWISDGQPHDWITPAGENTPYPRGATTQNVPDMADPGPGSQTYFYPNNQSSRMMWYHDHSYASTRIDVYAGIVSAFMIHDATEAAMKATGGGTVTNANGTFNFTGALAGMDEIPLIFEDKTFVPKDIAVEDAKWNQDAWGKYGDLWFPHVYEANQNPNSIDGTNPAGRWDYGPWFWPVFPAPLALPTGEYGNVSATQESFSDTPLINGIAYPNFNVEPKAYRFRLLNASLQRYLNLGLYVAESVTVGITSGGQGYHQGATVTFSDGTSNVQATGHVVVDTVTGAIAAIVTDTQGAGYTTIPTVTITDGTGAGPTGIDPLTNAPYAFVAAQTYAVINSEVPMVDAVMPAANAAYAVNTYDGRPGGIPNPAAIGPNVIMIGTEGGFLAQPNVIPSTPVSYQQLRRIVTVLNILDHGLYVGPAERADFVVDFSQFAGKTLMLYNDCPAPNPGFDARVDYFTGMGDYTGSGGSDNVLPGYGPNTRTIMRINVAANQFNGAAPAAPYDPAGNGGPLATELPKAFAASQDKPIVPWSWQNAAYGTNYTDNYAHIYAGTFQQPGYQFNAAGAQTLIGFNVDSAGVGYTVPPTVVLTGGVDLTVSGNRAAKAHAVLDLAGKRVIAVALDDPGVGYTSGPSVALNGGDGIGASATAITSATQTVNVSNKGIQELFEPNYGRMNATFSVELPFTSVLTQTTIPVGYIDPPTEEIADGETQFWKVTHNGVDTHVVHFHLFNVQVINRVAWDGTIIALDPAEFGWKETVKMNPLEDIYVAVKPKSPKAPFGVPQSIRALDPTQALGASAGFSQVDPKTGLATTVTNALYNFDWEYVWHCHILGHEENDFMRPIVFNFGTLQPDVVTNVVFNPATQTVTWTDPTPVGVATSYGNKASEQGFIIQRTDTGTWNPLTDTVPQSAAQASANPAGYLPNVVAANATSWVDPIPATAQTQYRVLAFNSAGYSPSFYATVAGTGAAGTTAAASTTATNTTYTGGLLGLLTGQTTTSTTTNTTGMPNAPSSLTATAPLANGAPGNTAQTAANGGFTITLKWKSTSVPKTGFKIVRQGGFSAAGVATPDITFTVPTTLVNGVATNPATFTDTTATQISGFTYTVFTDNSTTALPNQLSPGTFIQVFTPYAQPGVVSNVTNKVDPSGQAVTLSWTAPAAVTPDATNVTAAVLATAYQVVRTNTYNGVTRTDNFVVEQDINPLAATITPPATTFTDTSPLPGTSVYSVYVVNGKNVSSTTGTTGTTTVTLGATAAPGLQGLSANATSPTSVTLNWSPAPATVTGYRVFRAVGTTAPATTGTPLVSGGVATSYVDTTAAQNTQYTYVVQWLNGAAAGVAESKSVMTGYANPTPVTNLTAAVSQPTTTTYTNTLNWVSGGASTNYIVSRCVGLNCTNFTQLATVTTTSYADTTAVGATVYTYQVQAVNGTNPNVSAATTVSVYDVAPPLAPTSVTDTIALGTITVNWSASTSSNVTSYTVERSTDNVNFTVIGTSSGLSYADTNVTVGNTYYYKVASTATVTGFPAVMGSYSTAEATAVYKVQNAPALSATVTPTAGVYTNGVLTTNASVAFSFTETPLAGAPSVTGFTVYRSTDGAAATVISPTITTGTTTGTTTTYTFSDAPAINHTYAYSVVANNLLGASTASSTDTVQFYVPNAPVEGTVTLGTTTTNAAVATINSTAANPAVKSTNTTTVNWTAATPMVTGAPAVTGYAVYAYVNGATTLTKLSTTNAAANATSLGVVTTEGNTYQFIVHALNSLGESADSTTPKTVADGIPMPLVETAPAPVRTGTVLAPTNAQETLTVDWYPTVTSINGVAVTSYQVQWFEAATVNANAAPGFTTPTTQSATNPTGSITLTAAQATTAGTVNFTGTTSNVNSAGASNTASTATTPVQGATVLNQSRFTTVYRGGNGATSNPLYFRVNAIAGATTLNGPITVINTTTTPKTQ